MEPRITLTLAEAEQIQVALIAAYRRLKSQGLGLETSAVMALDMGIEALNSAIVRA